MSVRVVSILMLSLLVGLVFQAPANKLLPRFLPENAGVSLYELDGPLLAGHAGQVVAKNQQIDDLRWDLNLGALLLGRVSADISLSGQPAALSKDNTWLAGQVGFAPFSGEVYANELRAALPIEALKPLLKTSYLPLQGNALIKVQELELTLSQFQETGLPTRISGSISLQNLRWSLGQAADLGNIHAQLSTLDDGAVSLMIAEPQSEYLALQGGVTLNDKRQYQADLKIKPTAKTAPSVANQMKALGRTDKQGWYSIKQTGAVPKF